MKLTLEPYTAADIEQNPRLRDALMLLGNGNVAAAVEELKQQSAQGLAGAAFLLVAVYHQEGRFNDVISAVTRNEVLRAHSSAWILAGMAHSRLGNPGEGYLAFKRALHVDWQSLQAHRMAWNAIDALGFRSRAQALAKAVIKRDHSRVPDRADSSRPDLTDVTLCAVDCVDPELAARALRISAAQCKFGAVKLLTSARIPPMGVQVINIPHIGSAEAYSAFVLQELDRHIGTEFALLIQWDGYVLSSQAWELEFLNYDYIGARWTPSDIKAQPVNSVYDVGNGGFSLRSKRILSATALAARGAQPAELHPEDAMVCLMMRPELEKSAGIRFASGAAADRFSLEHSITGKLTFGFHGVLNLALAINDPRYSRLEFLEGLI